MTTPLLSVDGLTKTFRRGSGPVVNAVTAVSFNIEAGETLGLIGESGSGKSTVGRLVLGLLHPDAGEVAFDATNLTTIGRERLRRMRSELSVVFQEPMESLNPRMRVESIVAEPLVIFEGGLSRRERRERVIATLEEVGLGSEHLDRRPRDLSGGQQQRVGIARAIVTQPRFIVLDEPTSSLDLTVRATILNLLGELQKRHGLAYLFISHDIATVRHFCTRTAVMYLGRIVEIGTTGAVVDSPRHPYTRALLSAALSADPRERPPHYPLSGDIPSPTDVPAGCPLVGRCPIEVPACSQAPVPLEPIGPGHEVACLRATEVTDE